MDHTLPTLRSRNIMRYGRHSSLSSKYSPSCSFDDHFRESGAYRRLPKSGPINKSKIEALDLRRRAALDSYIRNYCSPDYSDKRHQ